MGLNIRQVITQSFEGLKGYLRTLEGAAIAFSADVDSTFLLKTAKDVFGDNVIAITAKSCVMPERELNAAIEFCKKENIKHVVFDFDVLNVENFKENPVNRCYICKKELFTKIKNIAKDNGFETVLDGSNADDVKDYRPGLQALEELGVKSPLKESNLSKDEIRLISNVIGLDTWNKPSNACLATRFAYGEEITKEKLKKVDEAEIALLNLGFRQFRVRIHSNLARLEVTREELAKVLSNRDKITERLKAIGFDYITLDLQGYRTGSMNELLNKDEIEEKKAD